MALLDDQALGRLTDELVTALLRAERATGRAAGVSRVDADHEVPEGNWAAALFDSTHRYPKDFNMALRPDGNAARTCPQVNKKAECKCLLPARENLPPLQKGHRSPSR